MPTVSDSAPPDNRHLQVISTLTRNDSLKSERSDKRVSFNNDVGIKHIPRGAPPVKQQTHPPPAKAPPDEWAECKPVKLQANNLTVEEVEQEAASIRDLVDSIDCRASPIPPKEHKDFTSRSLDRTQKRYNNVRANGVPNGVNHNRITNPIIRHLKADVNRREARRRGEIYSDSDSDRNRASRHKSVPNLLSASYNNGTSKRVFNGLDPAVNYSSVDNLLDEKNTNIIHGGKEPRPLHNSHLSADNLLDARAGRENLTGYKSLGNLPAVSDTDSTDISYGYRPKVNQIIQRFNGDTEDRPPRNADISRDSESSPTRGVIAPTRKHRHNNNKPFSYTDPQQVSTLQKVRNISPTRDVTAEDMYAQVNKHGIRQRLSMDSDYSAKIIITEDRPKTSYEGDDEAYETYQVQSNPMRNNRFSDYGLNLSKNNSVNNNINMSSVAVQTDTSKILKRERRPPKAMAPQPPVHEPYVDNYRIKKDLSSDLPSANLVRQINHGFGRFDRSPSPPPRKAFNRSNPRHVVPLLSDTSDSEPDYRRRSDPLAKIRNQVLMGERLQEEHDAEEWEEREMEKYERDKRNLNYNPNAMRPLTVDEVDALSLELDQHGDRKLVVSQKSGEKRSSSHHATHQSHVIESHADRSYSEDRSRPIKPLREKTQSNRDSSASRQLTLERNKKNNLEKEKLAQEKKAMEIEKENDKKQEKEALKSAKGKEKKNKEPKEKKKKRIKIKFFYDPRPHDKSTEDPLSRFTEYKGTDRKESDEIRNTTKTTRSRSYDSRSHSRERRSEEEISVDPRHTRDSSRERTLARPDRNRKTAASTDRLHYGRTGSGNDPSSHDDSNDDRRRVRSTDSYDRGNRYENTRLNVESRDDRRTRYEYNDDRNRRDYGSSDTHEKKYDSSSNRRRNDSGSGRDNHDYRQDPYSSDAVERRNTFLERREAYERRDSSVNRRDSRQDSSENRYRYRDDERDAGGRHYVKVAAPESGAKEEDKYTSSPDEDNKQERVMRQRKKFLSALMSDGRAKSSNLSSPPPPPPTGYTGQDNGVSTLKRSQSSVQEVHRNGRGGYVNDKLGHESDPPPPPSVVMSNNTKSSESPKKQSSSKKPKAKKKKKTWSWGFLGLRGNKRKKNKPTSRAGSEAGSNLGGSPLKRGNHLLNHSRPASRASSNRSSTRPPRPFVRASKIRKDLSSSGRVWSSSRALLDQRKETIQQESSTLQRPVGAMPSRDRRPMTLDDRRTPVGERFTSNSRGPRRTSEGSSESSAHRVGDRTMGSKQRYFGDSDNNDQSSRRTPRGSATNTKSGSGPGDYRSLPNRSTTRTGVGGGNKIGGAGAGRRVVGGGGGGSAGSSLQSSESENDSHQGSRASHVSTGSNRSVYLHATAVADIPVQKSGEDSDRAQAVQRQTRKVTRSFSLLAPWKPRHPREQPPTQHLEYDSRDSPSRHAAKPPRPPRRSAEPVARSHTMTNKDSKLSGWLKKRKNKEGKGI